MTATSHEPDQGLPLSSRQEWCWEWERCYDELYPKAVSLDCSTSLRMRGALDVGALRDALAEVALRHDALRLRLLDTGTPIEQVVRPRQALRPEPFPLETMDLGDALRRRELHEILLDLTTRPFEVTDWLARATLLRLAVDDHVLLTSFHHLVFDEPSHQVYLRDLAACYNRRVAAPVADGGRAPFSYVDFVRAENAPQVRLDTASRLTGWADRLRAHGSGNLLPGRATGFLPLQHHYDTVPLDLSAEESRRLLRAARSERVSLYALLAAALARTLGGFYNRERLILSTPSHGRVRPETRSALGLFSNMIQVPVDLGQASPSGLFRQVDGVLRDASAVVDLPFGRLAEAVLGRQGDAAFYRHALAHAELRLYGVTGWIVDRREHEVPMHGLRTGLAPYQQDFSLLKYATPQSSLAAAATLSVGLTMETGRLTGALRYETTYHGRRTAEALANGFRGRLTDLARVGARRS
ncbi:condensation domain-containing protein [Streptomyces sp. NPDC102259]|uniref:condensation domain-containing protein n=1 Tax=Streptomyces sp. NPDC102259 TaxID=3366148 RepID=UPI0037F26DB9